MNSERPHPKAGRIFKIFYNTNVGIYFFLPPQLQNDKGQNLNILLRNGATNTTLQPALCQGPASSSATYFLQMGILRKMYLREGKCHQGPTDHNEVQDIPQVTEVGARVE